MALTSSEKYTPEVDFVKASLLKRFIAELIDEIFYIIFALLLLLPMVLYFFLQDGMLEGRSIGKRIMGLRVVDAKTKKACTYSQSVVRNIFMITPIGFLENIVVLFTENHRRLGDMVANTIVIEDTA